MMQIIWYGQSCFQITTARPRHQNFGEGAGSKSEYVSILINPFSEEIGFRPPKIETDILLISHQDYNHNHLKVVGQEPFLITGPGEYEIKNIFIQGIQSWSNNSQSQEGGENTIYTIEAEDLKLCHLGDLSQKDLTEGQLEKIAEVDILMIPVGGKETISAQEALKIMSKIEPKITIPMSYQIPKLKTHLVKSREVGILSKTKLSNGAKLDDLEKFLKTFGIKSIEPLNKLSIKKKDISAEEAKIIVLKP